MNHNTVTPVRLEPAAPGLESTALPDGIIVLVTKLPKHRENVPFFFCYNVTKTTMRGYLCYGYKFTKTPGDCVIVLVPSCIATKTPGDGIIVLVTKLPKTSGKCIIVLVTK